jgi:hypothetical protein
MTSREPAGDRWDDWDSSRRRQLALGLEATPAARLAWLVAMIELAWRAGALPRRRPQDPWAD